MGRHFHGSHRLYRAFSFLPFGEGSPLDRTLHGLIATVVFVGLVLFAVAKSKRLSDFLEALSDEKLTLGGKFRALWGVVGKSER